ncbi:LppP/LprE family lipoprotein [Corynebacterium sp. H130]|uniref:LppP/LprE family lipoprotein n=1 Tax=Corynebacterium sp. H130 TaxID=3133444 RepID=UPI0030B4A097
MNKLSLFAASVTVAAATLSPLSAGANEVPPYVVEASHTIPAPAEGADWIVDEQESNFEPTRELSYVVLETEMGTASSPKQLMLFHYGQYLGTGTIHHVGYQRIVGFGDNYVTVEYGTPGQSNADVIWHEPVTYEFVGGHVEMHGTIPGHTE